MIDSEFKKIGWVKQGRDGRLSQALSTLSGRWRGRE